jgi:glutathione S-transferase
MINQTSAILTFLGRTSPRPIYPSDPLQAAFVDSIIAEEGDLFSGLSCSIYTERYGFGVLGERGSELITKVRKSLNANVLPRHLGFLDELMKASTTKWIGNTEYPTIADFLLVPRLKWLTQGLIDGISQDILAPYSSLKKLMNDFYSLPEIVDYYHQAT